MRTAVALSGGIDSFVAAHILKRQGHEIVGLTMTLDGLRASDSGGRKPTHGTSVQPPAAASRAAALLGIEHHVTDATEMFRARVLAPFLREYAAGRTPNPCVVCNEFIKFGLLMEEADALGADMLATGHHARVVPGPDRASGDDGTGGDDGTSGDDGTGGGPRRLLRGTDEEKDQSYFLYRLSAGQLARVVMPVGEMLKDAVRATAEDLGFTGFAGRESADICFAAGGLPDFIRAEAPELLASGPIEDMDGNVVGTHEGIVLYTIGQRSGLGVALGRPVYVARIDAVRNAVIVGPERELMARSLESRDLAWPAGEPPAREFSALAKVRYAAKPAMCTVTVGGDVAHVVFREEQRAIAPGQSIVFYDGEVVLGGGIIESA